MSNLKKGLLVFCALILTALFLAILLGGGYLLTSSIEIPDYLVYSIIGFDLVTIIIFVVRIIIGNLTSKRLKNKRTSEYYSDIISKKEELEKENALLRNSLLKSYKKTYYIVLLNYIILSILIFVNGFGLRYFSFEDDIELVSALYAITLVLFLIIPFSLFFLIILSFLSIKLDKKKNENIKDEIYPHIKEFIRSIFKKEGIDKEIVVDLNQEINVGICEFDNKIGISISYILLKLLTKEELESVLYHEIAHYLNKDTEFSSIKDKYLNRLGYLIPFNSFMFIVPHFPILMYENTVYEYLENILYEKQADELVLKKNFGKIYAGACFKSYCISKANELGSCEYNRRIYTNMKYDAEVINFRIDEIKTFYEKHFDYFMNSSKVYLPLQIPTHPTVRERIEKFAPDWNFDTTLIVNYEFDDDIVNSYSLTNKAWEEENNKENLRKVVEDYNKYLSKKEDAEKNNFDIKIEDLDVLLNAAYNYFDYETSKIICKKILEKIPNATYAKFILGKIYMHYDLSDECIPLLEDVSIENNSNYREEAMQELMEYYTETGRAEEKARIKENLGEKLDEMDDVKKVYQVNVNYKLVPYLDENVINGVIDLVKDQKEVEKIITFTKNYKDYHCHHFIIVFDKEYEDDEDKLEEIYKSIWSYLDIKDDIYNLNDLFGPIPNFLNKKSFIVYSKK